MTSCRLACSPSLLFMGACTRKRGCRLQNRPTPWPWSLGPVLGPKTLEDVSGAIDAPGSCATCDIRYADPYGEHPDMTRVEAIAVIRGLGRHEWADQMEAGRLADEAFYAGLR